MDIVFAEPKHITEFLNSDKSYFTEAFGSGKGGMVVGKLASILNRRTGKKVSYSHSSIDYVNAYGKFSGYLIQLDHDIVIRVNFKLGKSDSIESIDYYVGKQLSHPSYTVDVNGLNIVQIVDQLVINLPEAEFKSIAESIKDEKYRKQLVERFDEERREKLFMDWFNSNPDINLKMLVEKPLSEPYNNSFLRFSDWNKEIPFYWFTYMAKNFLSARGVRNKTFRVRKKGSKERVVEDPEKEQMLQDIVDGMTWEKKFEMVDNSVKMIVKGIVHSLVIYGSPGCIDGNTVLRISRGDNRSTFKEYTIKDAYEELNRIDPTGSSRPIEYHYWSKEEPTRIMSYNSDGYLEQKEILAIVKSGPKEVFKLTTDDGHTIQASKDHRFIVDGKYVSLENLKVGDTVLVQDITQPKVSYSPIISIESQGIKETYDIQMKDSDQPNFLAQGIVVHNSGKTEEVTRVLTSLNAPATYYKGTIKGLEELLRILYNHRDKEILVFDDFDTVFRNKDMILIFKAVLENKPIRKVTSVAMKNFTDTGKLKRKAVPAQFDFTSGIIFISNMTHFDSAILSRSINLRIDLTNDQMIDKINKTMSDFHPEVPMPLKQKAIAFLKEISAGVKTIDYRQFEIVIAVMQVDSSNWKEMALLMLTSQ